MFGGVAFMVRGNMCVGVQNDAVMARVGPVASVALLARPHVHVMDFTGRPMKGYVYVDPPGCAQDADLAYMLDACLAFNTTLPAK